MRISDMIYLVLGGVAGIGTSTAGRVSVLQLHVGGGLGDIFLKQPSTNQCDHPAAIDFTLD